MNKNDNNNLLNKSSSKSLFLNNNINLENKIKKILHNKSEKNLIDNDLSDISIIKKENETNKEEKISFPMSGYSNSFCNSSSSSFTFMSCSNSVSSCFIMIAFTIKFKNRICSIICTNFLINTSFSCFSTQIFCR